MFDEFIQTKFFGFLSCCIAFAMLCYFVWKTGYASGYKNGIKDNPKNREVHTYIYEDGRMLRFIPGVVRPCAGYYKCFRGDTTKCEGDADAECWITAAYVATEDRHDQN